MALLVVRTMSCSLAPSAPAGFDFGLTLCLSLFLPWYCCYAPAHIIIAYLVDDAVEGKKLAQSKPPAPTLCAGSLQE